MGLAELLVTAGGVALIAAAAMAASSLSVVSNANRLRRFRPRRISTADD